jgi:hypothetical protein
MGLHVCQTNNKLSVLDTNPYSSPAIVPSGDDTNQQQTERRRPLGIWLLSGWYIFLGGFLLLFLGILVFWEEGDSRAPSKLPVSDAVLIGGAAVMIALIWATAIYLWRGAKWAWWLIAFYCFSTALGSFLALPTPFLKHERGEIELVAELIKHSSRAVISTLFVLYFFKRNVLQFFGLGTLNKRSAVAKLFGASVCLILTIALVTGAVFYTQVRRQRDVRVRRQGDPEHVIKESSEKSN